MNKRQKKKALKKRFITMNVNMPPLTHHRIRDMDQMATAFELMLDRRREHEASLKGTSMKMDEADRIISINDLPELATSSRLLPDCQHLNNKSSKEDIQTKKSEVIYYYCRV